ncbi:unnamed protein product, partial [Mesorhabditis belari]|uniref:Uncharacterized protein n=1 Tax=Mesorhabditis belari TaxID=2138241 RepID=A0AAF3FNX9_9BILA
MEISGYRPVRTSIGSGDTRNGQEIEWKAVIWSFPSFWSVWPPGGWPMTLDEEMSNGCALSRVPATSPIPKIKKVAPKKLTKPKLKPVTAVPVKVAPKKTTAKKKL